MKIAVINESSSVYNLACEKIATYHRGAGHEVSRRSRADLWSRQCQKAYLSAIFTWDLPHLVYDARYLTEKGVSVEVGGPAVTAMPEYVSEQTGLIPTVGIDPRFEFIDGKYQATFTSRGCPRACEFCLVSKLEGRKIIEYDSFSIPVGKNPYLCDNNLLMTSWEHQKLVVEKLKHVKNLDYNSGFDDRIFIHAPNKYWGLYSQLKLECWRFAYDTPEQKAAVKFCADYLHNKGVSYRHIIVFCLVGWPGTTFEEGREKLQYLIDIGCSPYPMRYQPLLSLERTYTPPGWKEKQPNQLFRYFGVPFVWRKCTWEKFLETEKEKHG